MFQKFDEEAQKVLKIAKKEIPGALTTSNSPCIYTTVNDEKEAYLTGLLTEDEDFITAESLYDNLNTLESTYEVWNKENTAKVSDSTELTTGMILKRNGKIVGRLVHYGDINGDLEIDINDMRSIGRLIGVQYDNVTAYEVTVAENYHKIAMDVNHDGVISQADMNYIGRVLGGSEDWPNQNVAAPDPDDLTVEPYVAE